MIYYTSTCTKHAYITLITTFKVSHCKLLIIFQLYRRMHYSLLHRHVILESMSETAWCTNQRRNGTVVFTINISITI